jgi:hypothetical protein
MYVLTQEEVNMRIKKEQDFDLFLCYAIFNAYVYIVIFWNLVFERILIFDLR